MQTTIPGAYKIVSGQTSPEDALSAGNYPASGSYIDVSGYETADIVIHLGAIHASDAPKFMVKQTDSVSGTADTIGTANCVHTAAADDDDEYVAFHIATENLAKDHHFLTVAVSGVTNGSYGDIVYYLGHARHKPVTQATAVLPTASKYQHAG